VNLQATYFRTTHKEIEEVLEANKNTPATEDSAAGEVFGITLHNNPFTRFRRRRRRLEVG
jgi:hypothetical protein